MGYRFEFPDYDAELYVPKGFIDNSYHNDMMPRASKIIGDGEIMIDIWQDYLDVGKREIEDDTRFIFQIVVNYDVVFDYHTDNLKVIKKLVHSLLM